MPAYLSTEEKIELVKRAGYKRVELRTVKSEAELFEFKAEAGKTGLETPSPTDTIRYFHEAL